jgi:hypothetical protein
MKQVSNTAAKVLDTLTAGLNEDNRHVKIDNSKGAFMPVTVEYLHETKQGQYFSVCHYYEQNGDLMQDPEIVFLKVTLKGQQPDGRYNYYFPVSFKQANLGIDREYCSYDENGKIKGVATRPQKDTAAFCTMWMRNIKLQQKLN